MKQQKKENEEEETLDFTKPDFVFIPKGLHEWVQRGYYLSCKSCDLEHGSWVGREKILTGITDKGEPIFKKRKELGMV